MRMRMRMSTEPQMALFGGCTLSIMYKSRYRKGQASRASKGSREGGRFGSSGQDAFFTVSSYPASPAR